MEFLPTWADYTLKSVSDWTRTANGFIRFVILPSLVALNICVHSLNWKFFSTLRSYKKWWNMKTNTEASSWIRVKRRVADIIRLSATSQVIIIFTFRCKIYTPYRRSTCTWCVRKHIFAFECSRIVSVTKCYFRLGFAVPSLYFARPMSKGFEKMFINFAGVQQTAVTGVKCCSNENQ